MEVFSKIAIWDMEKGRGKRREKRERAGASSGPFAWSWGALTEAVWTRQPQPRCACTSSPPPHEMHSSGPRTASKHSSGCQEPEGSLAKQAAAVSPHACRHATASTELSNHTASQPAPPSSIHIGVHSPHTLTAILIWHTSLDTVTTQTDSAPGDQPPATSRQLGKKHAFP